MARLAFTCSLGLLVCVLGGCSGQPESAANEARLVSVTVNVKPAKGRMPLLDSIGLHTPAGEGVAGELPSGGTITTRVLPGAYKVTALPSSADPNASKIVAPKYQSPAETPWEINVGESGGSFDLKLE